MTWNCNPLPFISCICYVLTGRNKTKMLKTNILLICSYYNLRCYAIAEGFFFTTSYTISQRRQWHPTPVLLPGKSHGWRSLVDGNPWGRKESETTERLHFHFSLSCIGEGNGNPLQCSCLENPRDGEPCGLPSMGSHRVGHDWSDLAAAAAADSLLKHYLPLNKSILKEINPGYSLEGLTLKLELQYFSHLMQRCDSLEKTWMLGKIGGRRRRSDRGLDGWMSSLTYGHELEQTPGDGEG